MILKAQNVGFTNASGVNISGNTLTKTGAAGWNAGAVSTQTITSGDGYVEFTATETNLARMCGLGNGDSGQNYTDIEFAIQLTASDGTNGVWIFESGTLRGNFGTYSSGDKFRVAVESGVVKYKKNGTVFFTSSVTPTYPLLVDTSLYSTSSTVSNIVVASGSTTRVQWLVSDHLGTPRMIVDQAGLYANVKRHDYLPFGEELFAPTGGRTASLGYASGDGVRQQFTAKERDVETGLDYFGARYYASTSARFTSPDP
ncbi:MAG: RHS repeat-associated core domain-containing protein, partial [Gemmatimonadaceae bacterium]